MWPFRRRKVGKHALGAAVTAIPSAPRPVLPAPAAEVSAQAAAADPAPAPRVELGFRDGSTAALAPGSEQAKALTDLASVLTQRD
jgi:hypothetical protein